MPRATENSRTQHAVLRRLADELLALVERRAGSTALPFRRARTHRCAIKAHVEMEVEILYPPLFEHADPDIRELATR